MNLLARDCQFQKHILDSLHGILNANQLALNQVMGTENARKLMKAVSLKSIAGWIGS